MGVTVPPTDEFRAGRLRAALRPVAHLAFGGRGPAGDDRLEWQFRLDAAGWSPFVRTPSFDLSRQSLWLQGEHVLEVRARVIGHPETLNPTPAVTRVLIDTIAPSVSVAGGGDRVYIEAKDGVTPAERLVISYRFGGGAWRALGSSPVELPVDASVDLSQLEVSVKDEAGNVGLNDGRVVAFHGKADSSGGCGCVVAGGGNDDTSTGTGPFAGLVVGLAALFLLVGRRLRTAALRSSRAGRGLLVLLALGAAGLTPGCTCGGSTESPFPDLSDGIAIGRWGDLAVEDGRILASAYEEKYGDLVVVELDGDGGWTRYYPVDGVPPEALPVNESTSYRGGVVEPGEDVGAWTSIAMVHKLGRIAYQDRGRRALKFSVEGADGTWSAHDVDPGQGELVGLYASLTLNRTGLPGIAYVAQGLEQPDGTMTTELRWAQAAKETPSSSADWTITVIASAPSSCAALCGEGRFCVSATQVCATEDATCDPKCDKGNDQGCVDGACVAVVLPKAVDLPEGTGLFASAGRLSDGRPVVAFYDRTAGDLMLAVLGSDGIFAVKPLDATEGKNRGAFASLAIGADDTIHVAYQDLVAEDLLYTTVKEGAEPSAPVVIDDGRRADERPRPVGAGAALAFSPSGELVVAYQDAARSDLLVSRRGDDGWSAPSELLAGAAGYGFYTSIAVGDSRAYVSNYVYDRQEAIFGILQLKALP